MKHISLLIKPVSGVCNLNCTYCFYKDEIALCSREHSAIMCSETVDKLIDEVFSCNPELVQFAFQGGEPLLAGLDFFRYFTSQVLMHAPNAARIEYSVQTNGTMINRDWIDFFRENNFLVGISIDGARPFHDKYRRFTDGGGTYDLVVSKLKQLSDSNVDVNVLCVITDDVALHGGEVYDNLKSLGIDYIQFIPCLDPVGRRAEMTYSLVPEHYTEFLKCVFDRYYNDYLSGNYFSVRSFDDYIHLLAGMPAGACVASGNCGNYIVVESDGSLYPCDFFVSDNYCLGTVGDMPLDRVMESAAGRSFISRGTERPFECNCCDYRTACRGGCMRDFCRAGNKIQNYYCEVYREFFDYAYPRLQEIASEERVFMSQIAANSRIG